MTANYNNNRALREGKKMNNLSNKEIADIKFMLLRSKNKGDSIRLVIAHFAKSYKVTKKYLKELLEEAEKEEV